MQQPFEQYVSTGQAPIASHAMMPVGHTEPPVHSGGSVVWPGHRMQVAPPHSLLPHIVFLTQRLHGSSPVLSTPSGPLSAMLF